MRKIEEVLLKLETEQFERHSRADPMDEVFQNIAYIHAEIDDNLKKLITTVNRSIDAKRKLGADS